GVIEPRVHREIERKLEVPARFRVPALRGAAGITEVIPLPTLRLIAVYYDTDDLRLARHHVTLRRRTGGGDDGWHLKLPHTDNATRDEVQLPLHTTGNPPPQLATMVLGITRGAALRPVATLRTERRPQLLQGEDGQPLAELTDDRVTVVIDGQVSGRFREMEVEAATGRTAADLDPVVHAVVAAGATESGFASKAARALGPRAAEPPDIAATPPVRRRDPAGAAVKALIAQNAAAFVHQDLRVRRNLPDAIHQMRVAARRLRSVLKVFSPLLEPEWSTALRDELAWIAGQLGGARDREVLEGRLLAGLEQLAAGGVRDTPKAATVVRRELELDQDEATKQVIEAMGSLRYLALLDALVDAARSPRLTAAADATSARALPPMMTATWKRLSRAVRKLSVEGADDAWHQARIRAKQARYAANSLVLVFGTPARRMAEQLEQVTELLGRHQDALIAAEAARSLAEGRGVGGRAGYVLGLLHGEQLAEARAIRRQFDGVWQEVARPKWRRWLQPRSGARRTDGAA
ncbi:MAG: CYTH and CHAD domain-containing protein, partial [Ilumatobacteraceae bacterium]